MSSLSFLGRFHMSFSYSGEGLDEKLLTDYGIDEKNSKLIGFRVEGLMNKNDRKKSAPIYITLLVVKNCEWEKNYSTFGEYLENNTKIPVKEIKTKMNLNGFFKKYLEKVGGDILIENLEGKYLDRINYQD